MSHKNLKLGDGYMKAHILTVYLNISPLCFVFVLSSTVKLMTSSRHKPSEYFAILSFTLLKSLELPCKKSGYPLERSLGKVT